MPASKRRAAADGAVLGRAGPALRTGLAAAAVLLAAAGASGTTEIAGPAKVIDGDTLEILGQRVRLHGVDAPERHQRCQDSRGRNWRCGQRAALMLADQVNGRLVSCRPVAQDDAGDLLAACRVGERDLADWMVRTGWALADQRHGTAYVAAETTAAVGSIGIWSGTFEAPWEWRRSRTARRQTP